MLASICSSREQLAALVLARGIADLGRPAAHQHDRLVPGLLQPAQHHDLHQAADVQARRGRVEADVGGDDLLLRQRIERRGVGRLVDVAALVEQAEEGGSVGRSLRRALSVMLSHAATATRCSSTLCRIRRRRPPSRRSRSGRRSTMPPRSARSRRPTSGSASARRPPGSSFRTLSEPWRADELWQTTCFEAFLQPAGAEAYRECNFAPSGNWAAYDFSTAIAKAWPRAERRRSALHPDGGQFHLVDASARRSPSTPRQRWQLGLSAVLEEKDGTKSYWALAHPPRTSPISTTPDCFAAQLP